MKPIVFAIYLITAGMLVQAQSLVRWNFEAKKISERTYEIIIKAQIDEPWHLYSQNTPPGGPFPATINFNKNPLVILEGKTVEKGNIQKKYEGVFGIDVFYYEKNVDFVQTVRLKTLVKTNVTGNIEFMICNDHECMPPKKVQFNISIK